MWQALRPSSSSTGRGHTCLDVQTAVEESVELRQVEDRNFGTCIIRYLFRATKNNGQT